MREDAQGVAYYALFRTATDEDVHLGRPENLRLVARVIERDAVLPGGIPPPDPEIVMRLVSYKGAQKFD